MATSRSRSSPVERLTGGLTVPWLAKVGAVVIVLGLLADVVEHAFVSHSYDQFVGAFPLQEHAAHLVVLVGMVLVLAGIVADGVRSARRRTRQEGKIRNAIR